MSKNLFNEYSRNNKKTSSRPIKRKDKTDGSSIETEAEFLVETDNEKEAYNKEEEKENFTSSELQLLSDRYNVAVKDVISFLDSIEGKKSLKMDYLRSHFDNKQKDREIEQLKNLVSLNLLPASSSKTQETNNDDNDDLSYQRQVAATWGPFLMMRNLNPNQDDGIKKEIEELKALVYSMASNQQQPKNDDLANVSRLLNVFKDMKEVLIESEEDRRKKIEEETKQKQIEANKEKVAMMLNAVKDFSPMPEPEPSVPVYRSTDAFSSHASRPLNKKFQKRIKK